MRVSIIGGGVMGEALLSAGLDGDVLSASETLVCEKVDARRDDLASRFGVEVTADVASAASFGGVVILAVKPQDLAHVKGSIAPGSLALSIMAGVGISAIRDTLGGHQRVVRVMPNTPATVRQGMSAWTSTPEVTSEQLSFVRALLRAMGDEVYVDSESKIDMATAINGSGPAYVFLFIEALADAGVTLGLTRAEATRLATQTVAGSGAYALASEKQAAELKAQVMSPGGTTAAGLAELEHHGFRAAVLDCVRAAYDRAVELGRGA